MTPNRSGILGGFVKIRGDSTYITCAHVLFTPDQLATKNCGINDEEKLYVYIYEPKKCDEASTTVLSGTLRDPIFRMDNDKEVSIDAALV